MAENFPGMFSLELLASLDDIMMHVNKEREEIVALISKPFAEALIELHEVECPGKLTAIAFCLKHHRPETIAMTHDEYNIFGTIVTDKIDSFMLLNPQSSSNGRIGRPRPPEGFASMLEALAGSAARSGPSAN
jgi:hypothetical protein